MPEIWNRGHPPLHPLRGLSSRHWPRIQRLFCSQLGHWENVLESFSNPSTVSRMIPHLTLKDDPYLGPSQCWWDSNGFSGKLLPVISLKSQGETKLEINGKPYQIFLIPGTHSLNFTYSGAWRWAAGKTDRNLRKVKISISFPESL